MSILTGSLPNLLTDEETTAIFDQLEDLRFTSDDDELCAFLVHRLVQGGVYPALSGIGLSAMRMVRAYGARWHEYREPLQCKFCQADLCNRVAGPPFKREIGFQFEHDYVEEVRCPECSGVLWRLFETPPAV